MVPSIFPSAPTSPVAAAATAILCGDIILPAVAPVVFAAANQYGFIRSEFATSTCNPPKSIFDEVSLPVTKVPNAPMKGAING